MDGRLARHTITHALLPSLPEDEQRREIDESRKILSELICGKVSAFAYPYGDYTSQTVRIIREADFSMACTANKGNIEPGDDMLQLNRCEIHNWDLETFIQEVESFFLH